MIIQLLQVLQLVLRLLQIQVGFCNPICMAHKAQNAKAHEEHTNDALPLIQLGALGHAYSVAE